LEGVEGSLISQASRVSQVSQVSQRGFAGLRNPFRQEPFPCETHAKLFRRFRLRNYYRIASSPALRSDHAEENSQRLRTPNSRPTLCRSLGLRLQKHSTQAEAPYGGGRRFSKPRADCVRLLRLGPHCGAPWCVSRLNAASRGGSGPAASPHAPAYDLSGRRANAPPPRSRHRCPVPADCGAVVSFGKGEDGQLGHGDAESCSLPRVVEALRGKAISSVSCGAGGQRPGRPGGRDGGPQHAEIAHSPAAPGSAAAAREASAAARPPAPPPLRPSRAAPLQL
jgi:hypothetical protein